MISVNGDDMTYLLYCVYLNLMEQTQSWSLFPLVCFQCRTLLVYVSEMGWNASFMWLLEAVWKGNFRVTARRIGNKSYTFCNYQQLSFSGKKCCFVIRHLFNTFLPF